MELPRHRTPVQNFGGGILPGGTRAVPLMFGEIWPTQIWLSQEDAPPRGGPNDVESMRCVLGGRPSTPPVDCHHSRLAVDMESGPAAPEGGRLGRHQAEPIEAYSSPLNWRTGSARVGRT
jgi:hypothetical protein